MTNKCQNVPYCLYTLSLKWKAPLHILTRLLAQKLQEW